jgi:riboflavin kinase/FMN adenylyltransferase
VKVFRDAGSAAAELDRPWVTVGNFDGVHLGHRLILDRLEERAKAEGSPRLAVSFRPHPAEVLSDSGAPERLTSDRQQQELLAAAGVDGLLLQPFDAAFARTSAEDFATAFLRSQLRAQGVVVGATFRFGAHRAGDVAMLRRLSEAGGGSAARVEGVEPFELAGGVVSSSRIRGALAEGRVSLAEELLGRPFVVEGRVVKGDGRGRDLGFATANVEPQEVLIPAPGVYACVLRRDEHLLGAVTNVGRRPTFGPRAVGIEAHVFDFDANLYGERVRLAFLERIRDEKRFSGADELMAQIRADCDTAREILARRPPAELDGMPGF